MLTNIVLIAECKLNIASCNSIIHCTFENTYQYIVTFLTPCATIYLSIQV